jgi:hypothetical protein
MTADTFTPRLGLIEQGTGNNNNAWGTIFNNQFSLIADRAIAGVNTIASTGGTVDLSGSPPPAAARQDLDAIQLANGALTSDLTVIVPNLSKLWWFQNNTSGAFNMYVKTTAGTATQIPQGCGRMVMGDGNNNVIRSDKDDIGSIRISGKASFGGGELPCNGASYLRTTLPDLFTAIGTTWGSADGTHFTVPNFTDTGRFLRSSSGTLAVGTYQSNLVGTHSHTLAGAPTAGSLGTDAQGTHFHAAGISDPGHSHGLPIANTGTTGATIEAAGSNPVGTLGNQATTAVGTGVRVTSSNGIDTTYSAGNHTHNITGAPGIGTLAVNAAGGAETRPESAVVLMCIRY